MRTSILLHCCLLSSLMDTAASTYTQFYGQPTQIEICEQPFVNGTVTSVIYGSIESPGYPSAYVGPYDCTVSVRTSAMSWVGIYTDGDLQIYKAGNECGDFVSFKKSPKQVPEVVSCGNIQPNTHLYSEGSLLGSESIEIRFHADDNQMTNTHGRFSLTFIVADVIHPGSNRERSKQVILNQAGFVVSHLGFTGATDVYDNNIDSTFTLTGFPHNSLVELTFTSINLHFDINCTDSLNISGITLADYRKDFPGPLYICGSENRYMSNFVKPKEDFIKFKFKTGPSGVKSGFLIQYRIIPELPDYMEDTTDFPSLDRTKGIDDTSGPRWSTTSESSSKDKTYSDGIMTAAVVVPLVMGLIVSLILAYVITWSRRKMSVSADRFPPDNGTRRGPGNARTNVGMASTANRAHRSITTDPTPLQYRQMNIYSTAPYSIPIPENTHGSASPL